MKKAKIILASVAFLAIIGGALAFKATKFLPSNIWYVPTDQNGAPLTTQTVTLVNGQPYTTTIINCTKTLLRTTDVGNPVVTSSSTTSPLSTTVFTANIGGIQRSFTTTYHYCTQFVTRTAVADAI